MRSKSRARFLTRAWPRAGEKVTLKKGAVIGREPTPTVAPPPAMHKRPDANAIMAAIANGTQHELDRAQGKRKWLPVLVVREGRYTV
jgi:hypothetical protein